MLREGGATVGEQVAWAFRLITGRSPSTKECAILEQLYREQDRDFAAEQAAAGKLLAVGETKNEPNLAPSALAAGTVLAEAILNHDEAIMRR
jgi:hypothetical protein